MAAVGVWATPENTATLLKLLRSLHGETMKGDVQAGAGIAQILISLGPDVEEGVFPLLTSPDRLVRREACRILAEIGTAKCLPPLRDAATKIGPLDAEFYQDANLAAAKVAARN